MEKRGETKNPNFDPIGKKKAQQTPAPVNRHNRRRCSPKKGPTRQKGCQKKERTPSRKETRDHPFYKRNGRRKNLKVINRKDVKLLKKEGPKRP